MNTNIPTVSMQEMLRRIDEDELNVPVSVSLPDNVLKFTEAVSKNFEKTATNLDLVAEKLERAADELRNRAKELRTGAPDLRDHIEKWITYERESLERSKFLNTLFDK